MFKKCFISQRKSYFYVNIIDNIVFSGFLVRKYNIQHIEYNTE